MKFKATAIIDGSRVLKVDLGEFDAETPEQAYELATPAAADKVPSLPVRVYLHLYDIQIEAVEGGARYSAAHGHEQSPERNS